MSIAASEQELYDEFDKVVGDEKDPAVIDALKRVWLIWDKKVVPWMHPTWHTCSHCGTPAFCIDSVVEMAWTCSKCYYERAVKDYREQELEKKAPPKLDIEDFARI
jgi:CRISPR/Cas system-associated protein Cas10 (large subunit of type III CRISPR-Cas system)